MANSINWLASRIKQDKDNRLVSDTQITAWNNKANSTHTHTIANITNLQDTLDGKASSSHTHTKSQITDFPSSIKNPTSLSIQLNGGTATTYDGSTAKSINITPAGIGAAASSHTHTIANITNLQDTLDGKASSSHTHTITNVTGLQAVLDGKAASSHTHGDADITSVNASKITGTISIDHLPQGALDRLVRVDDDAARFKLTTENVQLGDTVKVKSSGLMYYVVDESKLGEEAGYEPYTAGSATSVPWSGVTGKPSTFTPSAHTHTIANVTGLQTALDGKAASGHNHDTVYSKLNHTHTIANVTNLQATLDSKVNNAPTLVTNWNNATSAGYYYAAKGATNAPEATLGYFGQVCKSTTSIMQTIFPEGASGDIKQYMRRGTISGSAVTWETDWACITYALS